MYIFLYFILRMFQESIIFNKTVLDNLMPNYFDNHQNEQEQPQIICQSIHQKSFVDNLARQLKQSENRLKQFIEEYSEYSRQPIRTDIIEFINVSRARALLSVFLTPECICRYAKLRVGRMLKNKKIKKNWSLEDIRILIWLVSVYSSIHNCLHNKFGKEDWQKISENIPGSDAESVMFKWLSLHKNNLCEQQWRQNQKNILEQLVTLHGEDNWVEVSKMLYQHDENQSKIYRGPKQCRQHWNCYLNPTLKKGPWEFEQDYLLMSLVDQSGGNKKWAAYVKNFGGRTQNALKNRYNLLIEKQTKHSKHQIKQLQAVKSYINGHINLNICSFIEQNKKSLKKNSKIRSEQDQDLMIMRQNKSNDGYSQRQTKKQQKKDQDWLVGLKNSHYLSYRKLSKNRDSQVSRKRNNLRRYEGPKKCNMKSEHDKLTQKQSSKIQKHDGGLHGVVNTATSWDEIEKLVGHKGRGESNMARILGMEQKDGAQIPSMSSIKIVEVTKQKLEWMKLSKNFIPCQLKDNKLNFLSTTHN